MQEMRLLFFTAACLTCFFLAKCSYSSDYRSGKIISGSLKYYLVATVNRTKKDNANYGQVVVYLYTSKDSFITSLNTNASDANKWAVGWDKSKDTIVLFNSDIGSTAYQIDNKSLKPIEMTVDLINRAVELKNQKYIRP